MTANNIRATMYAKLAKLAFKRAQKALAKAQNIRNHYLVRAVAEECFINDNIIGRKLANKAIALGLPRVHTFNGVNSKALPRF